MSSVIYEKCGSIAKVILNRPEKRNAISGEMLQLLDGMFHNAAADPEVKAVILSAAGDKAFTAGHDLKESMNNNITDIVERRADTKSEIDFFMRLWDFNKPIIAAVQGYCVGAGILLSFTADLIVAAEDATFGHPQWKLGYIPDYPIEMWKMPFNKMVELCFMSKFFSARELADMGVVNFVVPSDKLEEKTLEVANQVARMPDYSLQIMKESMHKCFDIRGFRHTVNFSSEMFNLARTHMQLTQVDEFRDDIANGGLKSALNKKYN